MTCQAPFNQTFINGPGVYLFKGPRGVVFYIGKATSLRQRIKSYCNKDLIHSRGLQIVTMVEKTRSIKSIPTESVLEALILEAYLIKKHQPPYNTKEKDNRSFNYIVITKEDFPRVLLVRGRILFGSHKKIPYKIARTFGPFPQGAILKDALKITRKIFPWRDVCQLDKGNPCFNYQIGLCPGVCFGQISKKEYQKTIRNIILFFEGKKEELIKNLKKEMAQEAKKLAFENAEKIKRTIFSLQHIQDVALIKNIPTEEATQNNVRIEAYDIAHTSGKHIVGVMTVVENGVSAPSLYRKFKIRKQTSADDTRALREVLERRLEHAEWPLPRFFVIDGGIAQKRTAERVLKSAGVKIPVLSVVKDQHHRPKEILGSKKLKKEYEREILIANNESHRFALAYHVTLRDAIKRKRLK